MKLRVILLLAVAALGCAPAAASAAGLKAGAARADITPPIGTPMFAYTARSAVAGGHVDRPMQILADPDEDSYAKSFVPSKGVHVRLQARAIVLERNGTKYALVQADLGGLPYAMTQEVAKLIAPTGIAAENILISATHTHSATGPIWPVDNNGYAALGGDLFDPRVFGITATGIAEAITKANASLRDAKLGVGTAAAPDASRNRNFDPFRNNTDVPADEAGARAVSTDPTLTLLRVDDRAGKPIGVWSNFAIHQTSFGDDNLLFSADNAAFTERIVEAELAKAGGADAVNVWTNGAEGDISPNGGPSQLGGEQAEHVTSPFAGAHMAGKRVATAILSAWKSAGTRMNADPNIDARRSFVAFDGTRHDGRMVGPAAALGQGGITADDGECAPVEDMAGPGQGKKLPALIGSGLVPNIAPISMWEVDGLGIAAFPSEITKQMGERIRTAIDQTGFDRVVIAGLTNAYLSYTATPEEYDTCHYEGSFTLFGRHMGLRWQSEILKLAGPLLSDQPASAGAPEPPSLGLSLPEDTANGRETPAAGTVVEQPAQSVSRTGRVTFKWNGGDPTLDFHRSRAFVKLQRLVDGTWRNVLTDDSVQDTTERTARDVWTETIQFGECDPTGTHRVMVWGRANKGGGKEEYLLFSRRFEVKPVTLETSPLTIEGNRVTFRAYYPSPGEGSLLAIPRLVRSGGAYLRVRTPEGRFRNVIARPMGSTGMFGATLPAFSKVSLIQVKDGCGNASAG